MSIEDPSLLSAYLDGSLDAAQRERMEAALRDDPELRGELGSLSGLKDRLGRLPRPAAPGDSSDVIVGRLQEWARQTRGLARIPRRFRPWLVLGPLSAAAAALLISWVSATYDWTPVFRSLRDAQPRPPIESAPRLAMAPEARPEPIGPIRLAPLMHGVAGIDPVTHGLRQLRDPRIHLLADSKVAGTLTITAQPLSVDLLERIDGVIHRSPRVAPYHALFAAMGRDRAEDRDDKTRMIYAIPLDPSEYARLHTSLEDALAGSHACLVEGEGDTPASRLPNLAAVSRVTLGEVEPSGSIVPFPLARVVADRTINPNGFLDPVARPRREADALGIIADALMIGRAAGDQDANRQLLRDLFGLETGRSHTPLLDSTSIYLIRIVEH